MAICERNKYITALLSVIGGTAIVLLIVSYFELENHWVFIVISQTRAPFQKCHGPVALQG